MLIIVSAFISAHKQNDHYSTRHTIEGRVSLEVMTGDRYSGSHISTQQSATTAVISALFREKKKNSFLFSLPNFAFSGESILPGVSG